MRFVIGLLVLTVGRYYVQAQTLEMYLATARTNNPVAVENENQAALAGLELQKTNAALKLPEISATGNFLYAPVVQDVGYDLSITNGALYSAQLNVNQPLFSRRQVEAQETNTRVNQAVYRQQTALSQRELARQVTEQYILTWQNQELAANTQRVLDILIEQEKVIRAFAENAILAQSDVLLFTIEKENQQLALLDIRTAYRQGLATLNLLCGVVDSNFVVLQQPEIPLQAAIPDKSGFLVSYQLDSLLAASNQELWDLKYRPQVAAFANGGLNAIQLKDIYKKFGFSVGVNFSITLYDGHQRDLSRQQMELSQQTSRTQRDFQANQVEQQRLIALQQIDLLDARMEAARKQLEDYEILLRSYRDRIAQGELSVNDYINVIKSFAAAQGALTFMETTRLLWVNNYNYWNW